MPIFYIDSSALVKRYRTETGTDILNSLFSGKADGEVFVTSQFTAVEIESVAARGLRGKVLNRTAHGVMLRAFAEDFGKAVVYPVSAGLVAEAGLYARNHALKAADAIHLTTALRVKKATSIQTVFVASDKELLGASMSEGFNILNPEAEGALHQLRGMRE